MKLIIDIPEDDFLACKHWLNEGVAQWAETIIANGTPEPERPQGEWIFKKFDEETGISNSDWCPFCGKAKAQVYDKFCGNCGAQLRKENNNG